MQPWKANINGKEYEYQSGTTAEVPDEVAALIDFIDSSAPKRDPKAAQRAIEDEVEQIVKDNFAGGVGYEETTEVVMLPETSFEIISFEIINEGGIAGVLLSESFPYEFEVGKEYIVTLDGVAKTYTAVDEEGVGIIRLSQGLSNSLVLFKPNDTKVILTTSDVSLLGTHTIKISEGMATTHKIDSKYIDRGSLGIEPLVLYKKQM